MWERIILPLFHYYDVIMDAIASQITSPTIVSSTVYLDADQSKHQSSASLAFVRDIHRGPVNFPHKWPVTRKMSPFDDVIMWRFTGNYWTLGVCMRCTRWHQDMQMFSALLALCEGNPLAIEGFPSQRSSNVTTDLTHVLQDYLDDWFPQRYEELPSVSEAILTDDHEYKTLMT